MLFRSFDGTANTANRTYTLPDKSGTIALTSDVLALAKGTSIGGVEFCISSTKPATRYNSATGTYTDGSALQIGDRWFDTSTGSSWAFNGTYWIGSLYRVPFASVSSAIIGSLTYQVATGSNVYIEKIELYIRVTTGSIDITNLTVDNTAGTVTYLSVPTVDTGLSAGVSGRTGIYSYPINYAQVAVPINSTSSTYWLTRVKLTISSSNSNAEIGRAHV